MFVVFERLVFLLSSLLLKVVSLSARASVELSCEMKWFGERGPALRLVCFDCFRFHLLKPRAIIYNCQEYIGRVL